MWCLKIWVSDTLMRCCTHLYSIAKTSSNWWNIPAIPCPFFSSSRRTRLCSGLKAVDIENKLFLQFCNIFTSWNFQLPLLQHDVAGVVAVSLFPVDFLFIKYMFLLCKILLEFTIFAKELVLSRLSLGTIKRERGVNPRQSRCCDSPATSLQYPLPLILIGKATETRSKSEDLPFIKVRCYSWDRAVVRNFSFINIR